MAYDRIQAKGYKHICDKCECDSGGAQCIPMLKSIYEEFNTCGMPYYWRYRYQYEPSCSIAKGHLCHYYWDKYIKPRIKDEKEKSANDLFFEIVTLPLFSVLLGFALLLICGIINTIF